MPKSKTLARTTVVTFEFVLPTELPVIPFDALVGLFKNLYSVIFHLRLIGTSHGQFWEGAARDVAVLDIRMDRTLTLSLDMGHTPKEIVRAITEFLQNVLLYRQERVQRVALNASLWEDVFEKRLANVRNAIRIAASTSPNNVVPDPVVHRLVEAALNLEQSNLRLNNVDVKEKEE